MYVKEVRENGDIVFSMQPQLDAEVVLTRDEWRELLLNWTHWENNGFGPEDAFPGIT